MKKHINIPVFIPHLGCPNQCVFCNQRKITGRTEFDISTVERTIEDALSTVSSDTEAEIAFFGGSFTGIERSLMIDLLKIANKYVSDGRVSSIRCSTRPDYIDESILDILGRYNVNVIELGLQSTDDNVLTLTKRGHLSLHEKNACRMIVQRGFKLVGQMMVGLPGSTFETEIETVRFICDAGAVGARIYPTVVFRETELYDMTLSGEYIPITLDESVRRCAHLITLFEEKGVKVIRLGLCASDNLSDESSYYAGPNHSAFGELVENEIYYNLIRDNLICLNCKSVTVRVAKGALSKAIGQNKKNKLRLKSEFDLSEIVFIEDPMLRERQIKCEERKIRCI